MKALIFAAGLGTRLKPYTDTMPKALVPVAGYPMLWHQVQKLKAAGIDELVINIHHFADQIVDYVHSEQDFGLKVDFSDERGCLLDTGGGLLHARTFLESEKQPFLIHNVDIFSNLDLKSFISDGLDGAMAKLLVSDRESSRKLLFDENGLLCGWKNLKTGELKWPAAKNAAMASIEDEMPTYSELAFGGVHLVSPDIFRAFDSMPQFSGTFSIIDFYLAACQHFPIKACNKADLKLTDIGKESVLKEFTLQEFNLQGERF